MPPIVIAAAVTAAAGIGAAAISSSSQKKAADQAVAANDRASQQQLAEQERARQTALAVNQPFLAGGNSAFQALLKQFNLPSYDPNAPAPSQGQGYGGGVDNYGGAVSGGLPPPGAGGAPAGGVDYNKLYADRPDVKAEYDKLIATADRNSPQFQKLGLDRGPEGFADYWLSTKPAGDDYQAPTVQAPKVNYGQPDEPNGPAAPTAPAAPGTDLLTAQRPEAGPAPTFTRPDSQPVPTFTRPDAGPAPTFTRPADQARPDYGSAPSFSNYFDPNNIQVDPSYQFRLKQGTDNTNSNFAARGLIKSGSAAKALNDYSQQAASQEYGNIFSRAMQRYQTDLGQYNQGRTFLDNEYQYGQNRQDTNYNNDRDTARDDYRFGVNRGDTNFNSDRSYGTNLALDNRDRSDRLANEDYARANDDYRYATGRRDQNFNTDRSYQTSRYDTNVGNLFNLADYGARAAGNVSGAQQTYANNAGNVFSSQANVAANAAQQRAEANAGLAGTVAGTAANVFNTWYGNRGSTPVNPVETYAASNQKSTVPVLPDYNSLSRLPRVF